MISRAIGLFVAGLCLGASGLFPVLAWAQSDTAPTPGFNATAIGKVITAAGTINIEHSTGVVVQANLPPGQTKVGDPIFRGDLIQTGADGALGITFADGTSFNVSSNARMEVNEFVYDPKGKSNSTLINLSKGTFTFIAGNIAHTGDMQIGTPLATMGIRGTAPRVEILEDGTIKFSTLVEQK